MVEAGIQNYMVLETPLGWVGVGYGKAGLRSLILPQASREQVMEQLQAYGELGQEQEYPALRRDLERYFAGDRVDFQKYPVDWRGYSAFRRRVLEVTATIPYGEVRTYKWVAVKAAGCPRFSRAVGGVMATNRLPIIVPCHRVIRSDGGLGGFGGGLELKVKLLKLEGIELKAR